MKMFDAQTLESMPKGQLVQHLLAMQEQLRLMATQQYGRRSEKQSDDPTGDLFNESMGSESLIERRHGGINGVRVID